MYDVAIIGGGVVGAMVARTLAKYQLKICVLEKENDVAMGATKANSAIVHAGFDALPGTLKAKLNVAGSKMMEQVAKELGVKYQRNGSLVIGFSQEDREMLETLFKRGLENGVEGLSLLYGEEARKIEPNLSGNVTCALLAKTGAIVCPYALTIAAMGNAMDNGAELFLHFPVTRIQETEEGFLVSDGNREIKAKYVVNAAGIYADKIAEMIGDHSFSITPRRGEYILLDKECGKLVSHTIFRTPGKMGKGILVTPTVDGNLLTGPTAEEISDKEEKSTTIQGLLQVMKEAKEDSQKVDFSKTITSFCGLRAAGDTGDFIINMPRPGFLNLAGIESPGLSASPAIAEMAIKMLQEQGLALTEKKDYLATRKPMDYFKEADRKTKNEIIKKDKRFGRIICRCEMVTEGEIVEAIRTNPKPSDLDGVKRRTRAQMGRCQGGFCAPYIIQLLEKELGLSKEEVTKCGKNSEVLAEKIKGEAI